MAFFNHNRNKRKTKDTKQSGWVMGLGCWVMGNGYWALGAGGWGLNN
jgi:hypothetical protein